MFVSRYLDPKADVVFKKIFGEHPRLLMSFLNAVLPLPENRPIVEIYYLPGEQTPKIPILKKTIADVKCKDASGRTFIVEMQIDWVESFKVRLLFEAGQAFVKQLERGEDYHLLEPVYGLGLIATTFDHDTLDWYHHYQLVNVKKPTPTIIEHLQLIFIELPKFPLCLPEEKHLRLLWLRFMREINEKTVEVAQELMDVPEIQEAISLTEEAAYSPAELEAYESYWDAVSREKTLMAGCYNEGLSEGVAKGVAQGVVQGLNQGQIQERIKIIQKMRGKGLSDQDIMELTGLSHEELMHE